MLHRQNKKDFDELCAVYGENPNPTLTKIVLKYHIEHEFNLIYHNICFLDLVV